MGLRVQFDGTPAIDPLDTGLLVEGPLADEEVPLGDLPPQVVGGEDGGICVTGLAGYESDGPLAAVRPVGAHGGEGGSAVPQYEDPLAHLVVRSPSLLREAELLTLGVADVALLVPAAELVVLGQHLAQPDHVALGRAVGHGVSNMRLGSVSSLVVRPARRLNRVSTLKMRSPVRMKPS